MELVNYGLDKDRFMGVLTMRRGDIKTLAARLGCAYHTLYYGIRGRPLSKQLLAKLRQHFGDRDWLFITRRVDTLTISPTP